MWLYFCHIWRFFYFYFSHLTVLSSRYVIPISHVTFLLSHLMVPLFFSLIFNGSIVTFDNTNITFDSTFVTFSGSLIFFSYLTVSSLYWVVPISYLTVLLRLGLPLKSLFYLLIFFIYVCSKKWGWRWQSHIGLV